MSAKKYGNEVTGDPCKENEFKSPRRLRSQMINEIISARVQSVYSTPKKIESPRSFNNRNCLNDNTNTPQRNRYLFNQKDILKSPLFKSPIFDKNTSVDRTQMDACPRRKRMISMSEYDTFKLELDNIEHVHNFEGIDLLHDLDSVIKFEDSKDILSAIMDVSPLEDDDGASAMNKDPATDPLSISDCEKKDPEAYRSPNSKFKRKRKTKVELKPQVKRRKSSRFVKQRKLDTREECLSEELENLEERENMPLSALKKLMNLSIKLIHKVPPQHKIERSGAHAPTNNQRILFQKYEPIRKGSYSSREDKIIKNNWEMFCELHDWNTKSVEPFLYWRHNGRYYINDMKERQKFVQFLANGLPQRTLYSVYSRFKILYRNKITHIHYTPEEDEKILSYMRNKHDANNRRDTNYSKLAKILRRTNRSIFIRYQYLKNQIVNKSETKPLVDVQWTLPLIKKFIKTLLDITLSEDVEELKNATLPKPLWQKMEKKLNIHQNTLKSFWQHQLHLQLFSTGPIYLNDIKIQLIEYMYTKGISNTREIIWPNVAKHFDGATAIFLCKVFFYLVQECNLDNVNNFADIVEYLYNTKILEIQMSPMDKVLPRIIYKNGKISLLNENESDSS